MKSKKYGDWTAFPVTIIKDGTTSHVVLYKRRRPNGTFEFQDPHSPIVNMIKPKDYKKHVDIQTQDTDTECPTSPTDKTPNK